ncbi:MAG: hypothetical protein SF051_03310, partial [Elusimicrobiota bacterium]|nr:hypothetical protein [Elusimicrobiota bacterium]
MPGLWADGWFYISSAGLLVSGALFFFLLGQYRAAVAADDASGEEAVAEVPTPATVPVRPVFVPDEPEAAPVRSAAPAPAPSPAAAPAEKKDSLTGQTVTGGVSPAVVYLQNLKVQLEEMGGELKSLAKRVNAISDRDEALIERLAELTAAVEALKSSAPAAAPAEAPAPAPAPKRSRRATDPKPEPVVVVEPAPAPAPAPVEPAAAADPLAGL